MSDKYQIIINIEETKNGVVFGDVASTREKPMTIYEVIGMITVLITHIGRMSAEKLIHAQKENA